MIRMKMLSKEPNSEECDARDNAQGTEAGKIKY
jgi:hypothetical protein